MVIKEALRLSGPTQGTGRLITEDINLNGTKIKKVCFLLLLPLQSSPFMPSLPSP